LSLLGIEPQFLGPPPRNLVTKLTELSRFIYIYTTATANVITVVACGTECTFIRQAMMLELGKIRFWDQTEETRDTVKN
jgi:hypothetical protein